MRAGIERIEQALSQQNTHHLRVLYGAGVDDVFLSATGADLSLEQALWAELQRLGFEQAAVLAPHRPVQLRRQDRGGTFRELLPQEVVKDDRDPGHPAEMRFLSDGPLQRMFLLSGGNAAGEDRPSSAGMGDVHGLRLLDRMMQSEEQRSVVLILQAESWLTFFEDQRTLAGLMGQWERLLASNQNLCLLVFSAHDSERLASAIDNLPAPELRSLLQVSAQTTGDHHAVLGAPGADELTRLLHLELQARQTPLPNEEASKLVSLMQAEGRLLRVWQLRFHQVTPDAPLTTETARQLGWFSATRDHNLSLDQRLERLVGLQDVKRRFRELAAWQHVQQRRLAGENQSPPLLHMVFTGNPGTGKTTLARLVGEVYHDLGLLRRGHLVDAIAADLVADHVGGTALKTNRLVDQALDGVLLIDEAYMLASRERGRFGEEALDTLLSRLEDDRGRLVVILAGYPEQMKILMQANPGLQRRFPSENHFEFIDYSPQELFAILQSMLAERSLGVEPGSLTVLEAILVRMHADRDEHFGNAGEVRNLVDALERRWAVRVYEHDLPAETPATTQDIPERYLDFLQQTDLNTESLLAVFNGFTGLQPVKEYLRLLLQRQRLDILRSEHNRRLGEWTAIEHLVFIGNPGTGKTTVARRLGKIYRAMGLLRSGHVVEVNRSDLVAGYVGQTAEKVMAKVKLALDGVLFIDEAYALARGTANDFGQEAIDVLVKAMEDYRSRLLVIAAGYPFEMDVFLAQNPGLRSRFRQPIEFPDLSGSQLEEILCRHAREQGYMVSAEVKAAIEFTLDQARQSAGSHFGNARTALALLDHMKCRLADRLAAQGDLLVVDAGQPLEFAPSDLEGFLVSGTTTPAAMFSIDYSRK